MEEQGKLKSVIITCCLIFMFSFTGAQSLKDHLTKADRYFQRKDYSNALENYLKALEADANDPQTNYKAGVSYLNQDNFSHAVMYLAKAYEIRPDVDPEIDYHLATAYQRDHQYVKARSHFESFRDSNKKLSAVINEKIKECIIGDSLMQLPAIGKPRVLGDEINTPFMEFFPIETPDGDLIFTSNRTSEGYQAKSGSNAEDVYIGRRNGKEWSAPVKISKHVNVELNDAAVSISPDGKTLFLNYEEGGGDIYTSTFEDGEWTKPVALNRFINHPQYRESAASISADGKKLFFSSNRPGGRGGFDIYVCSLNANGQWGRPSNLGSSVNTRQDEQSPFAHPDGVTLYFSSNGHAGLGGHDIYKSTLTNGKWAAPVNLGYPVNTSGYEDYFFMTGDNRSAYFSSDRSPGRSDLDIYVVDLSEPISAKNGEEENPVTSNSRKSEIVAVLKGKVIDVHTTDPLEATITLVDHATKDVLSRISTGASGDFELSITRGGNYGITTEKAGYLFNSMNFKLPAFQKYQEIDTHILMVRAEVGSKVVLKNIFFDLNRSELKPESRSELENIRDLLLNNPEWRIQINGHTDNAGNPVANRELSLQRAEAVVDYLVQAGISRDRLEAKGFGSEKPLVSNDDETEGREINRRTEIEIIR